MPDPAEIRALLLDWARTHPRIAADASNVAPTPRSDPAGQAVTVPLRMIGQMATDAVAHPLDTGARMLAEPYDWVRSAWDAGAALGQGHPGEAGAIALAGALPGVSGAVGKAVGREAGAVERAAVRGPSWVDEGIHSRLLNTRNGEQIGTLGDYLNDPHVRDLYADVLDTPIVKHQGPADAPPGWRGARGEYRGQGTIFVAAQPKDEFVHTLLHEAAHEMRARKGRALESLHPDDPGYELTQTERSAETMAAYAKRISGVTPLANRPGAGR